jgi:hypothetical protein
MNVYSLHHFPLSPVHTSVALACPLSSEDLAWPWLGEFICGEPKRARLSCLTLDRTCKPMQDNLLIYKW